MVCFDDLADLKEFQALPAVALRQRFDSTSLKKLTDLFEIGMERGFKRHGQRHWKVYLHTDRLIQTQEPALFQKLIAVMREADKGEWQCLDHYDDVNVRVVEYHHYDKEGGLTQKNHFDGGSLLTMVIMVSDPSKDFEGGRLQTWECDGSFKEYNLQQGDCVVFPSHKFHNVTPVTRGVRNIVAVELWTGDEGVEDLRPGAIGHLIPDIMGS